MELDSDRVGDVLVISIGGRVDWSGAQGFGLYVDDLVRRYGPGPIVLDTTDLTYIASGGIRAMLITARTQARKSAQFAVCSPANSFLRSLLATTGLDRALDIHATREAALQALGVQGQATAPRDSRS